MPDEWAGRSCAWRALNRPRKSWSTVDAGPGPQRRVPALPDPAGRLAGVEERAAPTRGREEYGCFRERIAAYMLKATKEAKVHTSWVNPNEEYDAAVAGLRPRAPGPEPADPFLEDFLALQRQGRLLRPVQLAVPAAAEADLARRAGLLPGHRAVGLQPGRPGQPPAGGLPGRNGDVGCPEGGDGGRPRSTRCSGVGFFARRLVDGARDGRVKLYITHRTLEYRKGEQQLFGEGDYLPLETSGERRDHLLAFSRRVEDRGMVVVVPRLILGLTGGRLAAPLGPEVWGDTNIDLPEELAGRHRNLFTGEEMEFLGGSGMPVARLLKDFPVALLEKLNG